MSPIAAPKSRPSLKATYGSASPAWVHDEATSRWSSPCVTWSTGAYSATLVTRGS